MVIRDVLCSTDMLFSMVSIDSIDDGDVLLMVVCWSLTDTLGSFAVEMLYNFYIFACLCNCTSFV